MVRARGPAAPPASSSLVCRFHPSFARATRASLSIELSICVSREAFLEASPLVRSLSVLTRETAQIGEALTISESLSARATLTLLCLFELQCEERSEIAEKIVGHPSGET